MKKILIWGTGQLAWHTINNVDAESIVGYIDTYKRNDTFADKKVYYPTEIHNLEYDAILVSLLKASDVKKTCIENNIDLTKVIFVYGNVQKEDMNADYVFVNSICGEKFGKSIRDRYHLIREIDVDLNSNRADFLIDTFCKNDEYKNDYIRLKTFELLVEQIRKNNVKGSAAELGVFRGDFAKYINAALPERTLYLFDTFEGFNENELTKEAKGIMQSAGRDIFKNTAESIVMDKMFNRDSVCIKKGFFPDSLGNGLDDTFCFVSLDCDWEESLFQGMKYFYPRLERGGYIMMHDYNNFLTCAKKAIKRYEGELGVLIPKVPICDNQGSIVITK